MDNGDNGVRHIRPGYLRCALGPSKGAWLGSWNEKFSTELENYNSYQNHLIISAYFGLFDTLQVKDHSPP